MNENQQQLNDIDQEPGASSWISSGRSLTIVLGFDNIRYGWEITRLPENCLCGVKFGLQHALFSKKRICYNSTQPSQKHYCYPTKRNLLRCSD